MLASSITCSTPDAEEPFSATGQTSTTTLTDPVTDPGLVGAAGESTTTTTTGLGQTSTSEDSSSTTDTTPAVSCIEHTNPDDCFFDPACRWSSVFEFNHGASGCQGDVVELCVNRDADGASSTWYRDEPGNYRVVQFDPAPGDLPPEWKPCDCEGPLACFCGSDAPDCPGRTQEFCGAVILKLSCASAEIRGEPRCAWLRIFPEGPRDDACSQQAFKERCLAVDMPLADTCDKFTPPYPQCSVPISPVFYREGDSLIEVMSACGPVPPSPEWTACSAVDTPEQPDECGCPCV